MKNKFLFFLFFLIFPLTFSFVKADTTSGLVGFWKLDEGTGTAISDSSGNGNNGTLTSSNWVTGKSGGAVDFQGASTYIAIPASPSLNNLSQFTYAAWINPRTMGAYYGGVILQKSGSKFLKTSDAIGNNYYAHTGFSGADINMASPVNTVVKNSWQLVVYTYDDVAKIGKLYQNGAIVSSATSAGTIQTDDTSGLSIGSPGDYYDGLIDEVRVYNRALTAQDIADLYNSYTGANVAPDIAPPVISAVTTNNITNGSATITWDTDELADSVVEYGLTTSYGKQLIQSYNNSRILKHLVDIVSLEPNTTYHYRVKSMDSSLNASISNDFTFTTLSNSTTGPVFPFLNFEGSSVLPTDGDKDATTGQCATTYPTQYLGWGTGTMSLDSTDAAVGSQSAKDTVTSGGAYPYWLTFNYDGCSGRRVTTNNPRAYTREMADNPSGWQFNTYNRMSFWIKSDTNGPTLVPNSHNIELGTFVRNTQTNDTSSSETGGGHYYHFLNIAPINTWTKVVINEHPNHQRGAGGNTEWGTLLHPTGEVNSNYFDAMTPFYLQYLQYPSSYPYITKFDDFEFYKEPYAENDDQVYSISAAYVPNNNRVVVTWSRNKNEDYVSDEVRYAFTNIHQIGWGAATPAPSGMITPGGSGGYNGMIYDNSTISVGNNTTLYIAIKPQNSDLFSQISIPLSSGFVPTPTPSVTPTPTSTPLGGDLNLDHVVNSLDWSMMNSSWFKNSTTSDLNHDGLVNSLDFAILSNNWGKTW